MTPRPELALGEYQHYKGNRYQVIDLAIHSETEEWLVVYRPLYGEGALWVRPYSMFVENMIIDGAPLARFSKVAD
ncbi:DUF1653 domain-containing protein [Deefgea sp. CFH1-16]|uniref:DUF1653 domain-containing protein n=1 Tax=Deefgea sp. CFH1-16 TaxID=2675457 RepID=UPI0015F410DD|nr:DUF1653 domain-containing protein [Deefgea sp. CFH1-16]MBM5575191.1 DUF1653 domain-containing protein [Deefgea sp. CFH1-16]